MPSTRPSSDRSRALLTLVSLAVLGASGCGLALGLGDFEDAEDGAGGAGATASTGSPGGNGSNTGASGGAGANGGNPSAGGGAPGGASSSSGVGGMVEECPGNTQCVTAPPGGWSGPVTYYNGAAPPAECPETWPGEIAANAGNVAGAFSCDACSCGAAAGVQCSVPNFNVYFDSQCSQSPNSYSLLSNGSCVNTEGGYGAKVGISTASGGTCTSAGGAIAKSPVTWDAAVLVCEGGAVAQCPTGVCAPAPEAPFEQQLCIYKEGEEPGCPLLFPNRTVVYRGASDTRQCSNCSCGAVGGATCPSVVKAYGNTNCSGTANDIEYTNGSCNTEAYYAGATFVNAPVGGSCPASGGTASGGVAPTLPLTVCCQ